MVALADEKRDAKLRSALELFVRIVRFEPGRIEMGLTEHAPADLVHDLSKKLSEWTGRRWVVAVSREQGAPTLREQTQIERSARIDDMRGDPAVSAVLDAFPGAEIVDVRRNAPAEEDVLPEPDVQPEIESIADPDELSDDEEL